MLPLALCAVLAFVPAPEVEVRTWTTAEGLPQSSVTAIDQGASGLLYLGTFAGLATFDGRRFDAVDASEDAGWAGLRVTALAAAGGQTLWVGTQAGRLIHVDDGTFTSIPTVGLLEGHAIWSLSIDDGVVWAAGPPGVARFDGRRWTVVEQTEEANVVLARDGEQWVGGKSGLFRLRGEQMHPVPAGIGGVAALCHSKGDLVAGGALGVVRIGPRGVTRLDDRETNRLLCAADGTVWSAARQEIRALGTDLDIRIDDPIRVLFEDRERNIWVGSDGGGLTRIIREDWTVSEVPGGALPVMELADGTMLVGGFCGTGGLFRLPIDGAPIEIAQGCTRALLPEGRDVLVGTDEHILRWSEEEGFRDVVNVGHPILALAADADALWIGTDTGGAMRYRNGALEPVDVGDARVLTIATDDAATWFGTHGGLSRLGRDDGLTRWTSQDGVPHGPIRALLLDGDGTVFMASYGGGLGVFRDGVFSRLTVAQGLGDAALSSIIDDGDGSLWINGNRGVTRLPRDELDAWLSGASKNPRLRRWDTPEGNGGGQPAGAMLRDGTIVFPTARGIVRISPRSVFRNPVQPSILLHNADVDGVELEPGRPVQVGPGPGRVHVEFTAATLRHPELATLEYRVVDPKGAEPDPWQLARDGTLVWESVAPGPHLVELRATNEDGVPSPLMRLQFDLEPHLHQRWSFWLGIVALCVAAGAAAHAWRTRAIADKNRALEREVRQRIAAQEEQRMIARRLSAAERMEAVGRLAGGIAHDFNNLLTAVAGTSAVLRGLQDEHGPRLEVDPLLDNLDRCVDRGASLTRSLLSFARQQPMAPSAVDAEALVRNLLPMLETSLRDDVSLRVSPPESRVGLHVDPALLELALVNLALNAQAALPRGGTVTIGLDRVDADALTRRFPDLSECASAPCDAWAVVWVRDDGEGMSPEVLARAREPFFTSRAQGNGLGLPSVEGFAEQSGGAMHLASEPGQGTTVSLVLPFIEAPERAVPATADTRLTKGAGHVVLCDDDELVRQSLVRVLQLAGYTTQSFSDPALLLAWLDEGADFDVLVTDVLMPGMSGDALARHVRALRPQMPIVFMSGYTDDIRTETLGGPLLSKPFRSADVVRAVEQAIARG